MIRHVIKANYINKVVRILICIILLNICVIIFLKTASAYWVWTPETKKFINPKYAVKDSPKEQFDWAMSFYDTKDYQRAAVEFEKLTKHYEYSEYASKAQYYVGLSYENLDKFYIAFQNYQKAIDNFPHIENIDEIIARQFNIGKIYASRDSPKILGTDIMTSLDRAIEIYKKVVDNAPYGKLADEAQFNMGDALKRAERYDEAILTFQKIVDDYPASRFREKAQYEVAYCAYKASLKPAYDVGPTDKAIKAFEEFAQTNRDKVLSDEADKTIRRLKEKSAEKSLLTAKFYESQKRYESAIVYYQDIVDRFPDASFADGARAKIEELKRRAKGPASKAALDVHKESVKKAEIKKWFPFKVNKEAKPHAKTMVHEVNTEKVIAEPAIAETKMVNPETKPRINSTFRSEGLGEAKPEGAEEKVKMIETKTPEPTEAKSEEMQEAQEDEIESSVEKVRDY